MPVNFYKLLNIDGNTNAASMPQVKISKRKTDKFVAYDYNKKRLDVIAGEIYEDESMWRLIMWANPDYFVEYDIPTGTVLRVPFPLNEVVDEVKAYILNYKKK